MIAVLLASASVAPRCLQMTTGIRADPHLFPRRRNHQRADTLQLLPIRHTASGCREVAERRAVAHAPDAWAAIGRVAQSGRASGLGRGRGVRAGMTAQSVWFSHDPCKTGIAKPCPPLLPAPIAAQRRSQHELKNRIVIGDTLFDPVRL